MNIFAISGILIGATSPVMAVLMFLFFLKSHKKEHFLWSIFCVSVAIWGGGAYKIATTADVNAAEFWWRITHIGVIFIPILFTHFVYTFLKFKRKKLIFTLYLLGIIFLISNLFGNLFIANMRWVFGQFYYDSPPGILYIPFTLMFFGLVIYSHIELWLAYRKAKGVVKEQIKYFLVGMGISFFGGSLSFLPVYKIDIYPVLNLAVCLYPIIIAYAITRYRLMDIRIAFRKSIAYVFAATFAYGSFYFVVWMLNTLFGSIYARSAFIFAVLVAIVFVVLFFLFSDFIKRLTNKYLFGRLYSQHEAIKKFSQELTSIIDLDKLIDTVADVIKKSLGVDKFAIFLVSKSDECRIYKNINFNQRRITSLACDNNLIKQLKQRGTEPLIMEELNAGTGVILPLVMKNKLRGIVVLGERTSNEVYSKEDIELLETLSNQVSIALENARLYDQVQDLTENLQEKVDEQVNKIKELLKTREELLTMKEDFLTTVSHQLRTPVSIFYGLLDEWAMAKEERKKKIKKNIVLSAERLKNTVNDMLDAMEIERGMEFNFKETDLTAILNEIVSTLKPNYDKKKLSLKLNIPKSLKIQASEQFLKQALTNLIDNAERYTKEGGTEIDVSQEGNKVKIIIKDTGIGLTPEDKEKIFKTQFFRGDRSRDVSPDGSGLGLYIAKRIIDKHKGTIEVESEGINKGSTFIINLPI